MPIKQVVTRGFIGDGIGYVATAGFDSVLIVFGAMFLDDVRTELSIVFDSIDVF